MLFLQTFKIRVLLWVYSALVRAIDLGISGVATIVFAFSLMTVFSLDSKRHAFWNWLFTLIAVLTFLVGPGAMLWSSSVVDKLENTGGWHPGTFESGLDWPIGQWITGGMLGVILWWLAFHYAADSITVLLDRLTRRTSISRSGRTDIRTVRDILPKSGRSYDPNRYFKEGRIFVGLNEKGQPLYIPYETFRRSHIQLIGTTGAGKGVEAGLMKTQAMMAGEAVIVVDPKNDEWAPHVCRQAAEQVGRSFVLFDLRCEAGQFNLIQGASAEQVEELLVAGLGLSDRGQGADHFRVKDRRAARELSRRVMAEKPRATLADLVDAAWGDQAMLSQAEGFVERLSEIARPAVCAAGGPSLANLIAAGACIYVVGSMRHGGVINLQRMLLVRLCQLIEERDRLAARPRQVLIFLDELKMHISRPALEMLGAIRDKGAHLILAHQSVGDLRDCPADLNPDAVVDAVIENCKIRIAYKVQSADTAEWLARTTDKILVDDETRHIQRTKALAETTTGERTIRQAERPLIDENMLLGLPEQVAVVFSPELIEFAHICPVPVEKAPLKVNVVKSRQASVLPRKQVLPDVDL